MNEIQVFNYGEKKHPVRTVEQNGEVWFVAKDVCDVLELTNPTEALKSLDDDEKNTLRITEGIQERGNPNMNVISEPDFTSWRSRAGRKRPRSLFVGLRMRFCQQ